MRIVLNYRKLKEDFNRLEVLRWGHFAFTFLAITLEFFNGLSFNSWLLTMIFLAVVYRLFFVTKKELFYSFWPFSCMLILFFLTKSLFGSGLPLDIRIFYILALFLLSAEMYILSSPIYYPRVSWWEYDFRYRTDLKVFLKSKDIESESRVTDLRRGAGCIASFEEFNVGKVLDVESSKYFDDGLSVEIISKRIYSLGRPFSYGVKFDLSDSSKRSSYEKLLNIWKNETLERRQRKFKRKT